MKKEAKNSTQSKAKNAVKEQSEEEVLTDEIALDDLDQNNEEVPFLDDPSPEETFEEVKEIPAESNDIPIKAKIKALKRAIENKTFTLDRMKGKAKDWRSQADSRDEKANAEYEKRKKELTDELKKVEERHNKRIERTRKLWRAYTDSYEATKIKGVEKDIEVLQTELTKLELLETKEQETK